MIKNIKSIFYNTLEELHATYKPNHPDVLFLKKMYGDDINFSRIMYPENVIPRFELSCYKILEGEKI